MRFSPWSKIVQLQLFIVKVYSLYKFKNRTLLLSFAEPLVVTFITYLRVNHKV